MDTTAPSSTKKTRIPWKLATIVLSLTLCLICTCLMVMVISYMPSSSNQSEKVTETTLSDATMAIQIVATDTTAPTSTVVSTNTPAPTSTPVPTNTPRVTNTPVPTSTPDLTTAYRSEIAQIMPDCLTGIQGMADVSSEAADNPYLLVNDDWKLRAAMNLSLVNTCGKDLKTTRKVPVEYKQADALLVKAGGEMLALVDDFTYGVDHLNADRISQASTHMLNVSELISKATSLLPK